MWHRLDSPTACFAVGVAVLSTVLAWPGALFAQSGGAQASTPPATAASTSQQEAAAVLKRMTEYLARLQAYTVTFRDGYDVVQPTGQKIEFGETRNVALARPNHLRVEEVSSDGSKDLAIFDGKTVTAFDGDAKAYAQAPQPGSLDDSLVYFVRDLRMRMPLALLMTTRLPEELPGRITSLDYVETTEIWGEPTDHIAGRTANVDFQFWVTRGERPLPLRVVITYRNEPGQPQFWANLANWNTSPQLPAGTFEFKPPEGSRRIDFAVQARDLPPAARAEVQP
jgi:hypothetical protein